jgi:hypothetical protein
VAKKIDDLLTSVQKEVLGEFLATQQMAKEPFSVDVPLLLQPESYEMVRLQPFAHYRVERLRLDPSVCLMVAVSFVVRKEYASVFARKLLEDKDSEAFEPHPAAWYVTHEPFRSKGPHHEMIVVVTNPSSSTVQTKLHLGGQLVPWKNIFNKKLTVCVGDRVVVDEDYRRRG